MDDWPNSEIPDFARLAADPEIAALLDFEPVPRKIEVPGGWSPDRQREVIARLAVHGSPNRACDEMGMHRTGLTKLYKSPKAKSFRAAWDSAVALATKRREEQARAGAVAPGATPPTLDNRRKLKPGEPDEPLPGQVRNEFGEWEDEESLRRRVDNARDRLEAPAISMTSKTLIRRAGVPLDLLGWAFSCHRSNFACGQCRGCAKHFQTFRHEVN